MDYEVPLTVILELFVEVEGMTRFRSDADGCLSCDVSAFASTDIVHTRPVGGVT